MWLAVGVLLAVACVLLVARPFLRDPQPEDDRLDQPAEREQERTALAEERDRALAALKELEFDHRTGKISDDDYRELVGPLRRTAAGALRALDAQTRYRHGMTEATMTEAPTPAPVPEPGPPPDEATPPSVPEVPEPSPQE